MFRNMRVAARSALGFGLIALIVLLVGIFSLMQMAEMHERSEEIDANWLPSIQTLSDVDRSFQQVRALTLRLAVLTSEAELRAAADQLKQLLAEGPARQWRCPRRCTTVRSCGSFG